jgi:hypothetical protein
MKRKKVKVKGHVERYEGMVVGMCKVRLDF